MSARLVPGRGGLLKLLLSHASGSTAEVYLHGGHVTSWRPAGGGEALFVSGSSRFEAGAAIRGGVPVIFPQFADLGPFQKHGFARTVSWEPVEEAEEEDEAGDAKGPGGDEEVLAAEGGTTRATLRLQDSEATRTTWPYAFRLELGVRLGARTLELRLSATNTGDLAFEFTAALHSYLRVADVRGTRLLGLGGARYLDRTADGAEGTQLEAELAITGEVDRLYLAAPDPLVVEDGAGRRRFSIREAGFGDTVVWNPGPDRARKLSDLDDLGYLEMVCVEGAQVSTPVRLEPGGVWRGAQRLELE